MFAWLVQLTTGPDGVRTQIIDAVALTYLIARVLFTVCYLAKPSMLTGALRSLFFFVCFTACSYLFVTAIAFAPKPNY